MDRLQVWWTQLVAVFSDTFASIITYLPVVLSAIAVVLIGWLLDLSPGSGTATRYTM